VNATSPAGRLVFRSSLLISRPSRERPSRDDSTDTPACRSSESLNLPNDNTALRSNISEQMDLAFELFGLSPGEGVMPLKSQCRSLCSDSGIEDRFAQ